ncbi:MULTISPECIES: ATP-binding protein [unclassified Frankia]|uniref:ATP-binding protein n=1 Tax=unclassified Frankia TaxID=2632575 RepID=UPI0020243240
MTTTPDLYPRHAVDLVEQALIDTRVVVINGARQVGKSTLAQLVASASANTRMYFLDDAAVRDAAGTDPTGFVRHDGLLLIDEIQRVPELLLGIKLAVDRDPRPGQFLLTGSARLLGLRDLPDALPGRSETIELWPLSQGEIHGAPDSFIDTVFNQGPDTPAPESTLRRPDYVARALRGGYPEAVRRTDTRRRGRFFDSYLADLIARDIRQVSEITRVTELRRLIGAVAACMAGLVVPQRLSRDLGIPASTVRRHLDALELIYVVRRIPAWSNNLTTRAVATPKTIMTDSGLAGHLTGMSLKRAAHPTAPVGQLLENFVIGELARQLTWAEEPVQLFHYRDRDGNEVDAVLERASGEIVGIEVKASETVRADDFRGLHQLARKAGDQFIAGYVMYTGAQPLPFGDRMHALPIETIWTL